MTNRQTIKHLTQTAMVTALIIVLGFFPGIPVGFIPVPIVLQNMGIFLAAELLGRKYGTIAVGLFLGLVALGLPLLSGGAWGCRDFSRANGWLSRCLVAGTNADWNVDQNNPGDDKWLLVARSWHCLVGWYLIC